jgi:uncharacterized membrane protein YeaQ/YmgE (transglycosylase-associated protein family)
VLRLSVFAVAFSVPACLAQSNAAPAADGWGEVVTIETHGRTTTRYMFASPPPAPAQSARIAVVLLVGGGGYLDLDNEGCPRELTGNNPPVAELKSKNLNTNLVKEVNNGNFILDRTGAIVGVIAKFIMPGRDPGGIIITILIGIAGAFIGSFLGFGTVTGFNAVSIMLAIGGAVLLLILYRVIKK